MSAATAAASSTSTSNSSSSNNNNPVITSSTVLIGNLWEDGEVLLGQGKYHEACLSFLRAKAMLITESKPYFGGDVSNIINGNNSSSNSSNNNSSSIGPGGSKMVKIYGELMKKLSSSIDRALHVLNSNPVIALNLNSNSDQGKVNLKSITPKAIKTNYRQLILKFHPDKNTDCDTSCIFTCIQAAYDKLSNLDESNKSSSSGSSGSGGSGEGGDGHAYPQSFYEWREERRAQREKEEEEKGREKERDKESPRGRGGQAGDGQQKQTCDLSSDTLKELLKAFGFEDRQLARMGRDQLVKNYLATVSYLNSNARGGGRGGRGMGMGMGGEGGDYSSRQREPAPEPPFARNNNNNNHHSNNNNNHNNNNNNAHHPSSRRETYANDDEPTAAPAGAQRQRVPTEYKKFVNQEDLYFRKLAKDLFAHNHKLQNLFKDIAESGLDPSVNSGAGAGAGARPRAGRRQPGAGSINSSNVGGGGGGNNFYYPSGGAGAGVKSSRSARPGRAKPEAATYDEGDENNDSNNNSNNNSNYSGHGSNSSVPEAPKSARWQDADSSRQGRAAKLKQDIPNMSLSELKRLLTMSGLSMDGCVEKNDIIDKLYQYYGIEKDASTPATASASASSSNNTTHNKADANQAKKPNNAGTKASAAESAMRSRFARQEENNLLSGKNSSAAGSSSNSSGGSSNNNPNSSAGSYDSPRSEEVKKPSPYFSPEMDNIKLKSHASASTSTTAASDANQSKATRKPDVAGGKSKAMPMPAGEVTSESLKSIIGKININYTIGSSISGNNDAGSSKQQPQADMGLSKPGFLFTDPDSYFPNLGKDRVPVRRDLPKVGPSIPLHGLVDEDDDDDNYNDDDDLENDSDNGGMGYDDAFGAHNRDDDSDESDGQKTGRSSVSYYSRFDKMNLGGNNRGANSNYGSAAEDDALDSARASDQSAAASGGARRPSSVDKLRQAAKSNKSSTSATTTAGSGPAPGSSKVPQNDGFDEDLDQIYNDIFNYHFSSAMMKPTVPASTSASTTDNNQSSNKSTNETNQLKHTKQATAADALEIQEEVDFWLHNR